MDNVYIHVCPVKKSTLLWTVHDTFLEEHSEVTLKLKKLESQVIKKFETIFRLYIQLFVGGLISYLSYLCLLAYSGGQHILCCVFFSSSCVHYVAFLWIVHFWLPLQYSLTFISNSTDFAWPILNIKFKRNKKDIAAF